MGLARELRIEVVVEGIETTAQLGLLRARGGRIAQGYYFARPQTAAEITDLLRAGWTSRARRVAVSKPDPASLC